MLSICTQTSKSNVRREKKNWQYNENFKIKIKKKILIEKYQKAVEIGLEGTSAD